MSAFASPRWSRTRLRIQHGFTARDGTGWVLPLCKRWCERRSLEGGSCNGADGSSWVWGVQGSRAVICWGWRVEMHPNPRVSGSNCRGGGGGGCRVGVGRCQEGGVERWVTRGTCHTWSLLCWQQLLEARPLHCMVLGAQGDEKGFAPTWGTRFHWASRPGCVFGLDGGNKGRKQRGGGGSALCGEGRLRPSPREGRGPGSSRVPPGSPGAVGRGLSGSQSCRT